MALSLKNNTAEKLARQLAAETGESLTEAIIHSLEERLERLKGRRSAPDLVENLLAISRRCSKLPDLDTRDADEILGYDEVGGKPVALLAPVPLQERPLSPDQEAALERILNQSHHLGGRASSRDELHER